jgi:hypothetical protein
MESFVSFIAGLAFMWAVYTFAAIPRWYRHFRKLRGKPRLYDAFRKRK